LGIDHPLRAASLGDHFASRGVWQTPDTIQCLLSYPGEVQMMFEGTFSNAHRGARIEFMGTDATLYLDRGAYLIHPERGIGKEESMILGTDPRRGRDFYDKPDGELLHLANWVGCVRSRSRPNCPAEAGAGSASAAHLGNLAYRSGRVAVWSDS
ncbi:MAG: gfo/Idh/MocA family oxidoreductase, partial [Planctomycetia bacterium]|nr:gfo/Idh/MocA family oxidoreductase [Planctomycetia bacterium]